MKLANGNVYKVDTFGHLKLANSSWLSSLVASLLDPYQFKLANGNVYNPDWLSHSKLANSSSLSSSVASLWDRYQLKLANVVFGWRNLNAAREILCALFCFHDE